MLLERLGRRLGHAFRDRDLLLQALTHSSFANEHPGQRDNGALAFLGDAVLALVVGERLWRAHPDEPEGLLTPRRAELVSGASLARWAAAIELGPLLRLGRGEEQMGGREKESVLATALEAVLAVVYLEAGLEGAHRAVASLTSW
ncbi:MAG TPA: ribonuclease III domain-containing protein [Candidatus Bathyarchaeia archaeon]|nr:ribonuclease III domain-containing protein [Candidatus Bathyarchaeia archaeon]